MVRTLNDEGLDDSDRCLLSNVEEYGWHVVFIPEEDGTPGWAFSVGLYWSYLAPEVVVFGLNQELSHRLINTIGEWTRSGERMVEDAMRSKMPNSSISLRALQEFDSVGYTIGPHHKPVLALPVERFALRSWRDPRQTTNRH